MALALYPVKVPRCELLQLVFSVVPCHLERPYVYVQLYAAKECLSQSIAAGSAMLVCTRRFACIPEIKPTSHITKF